MALTPLIIVSGPSGSGKTTITRRLLQEKNWPLRMSVSVTTREPRKHETEGVDYHFWTAPAFVKAKDEGAFLEWAQVHGNYYGTLKTEVQPFRANGTAVLLDIDVQGSAQVRKSCPEAVSIFIKPSTLEVLEMRLRERGTESEEAIQNRLRNARAELARAGEYEHEVINDDLETALNSIQGILGPLFDNLQRSSHAR